MPACSHLVHAFPVRLMASLHQQASSAGALARQTDFLRNMSLL